jgi:hypothetical protein
MLVPVNVVLFDVFEQKKELTLAARGGRFPELKKA